MANKDSIDEHISNLHMENYFPKDIFATSQNRYNFNIYQSKAMEKYFESQAKENVSKCQTSVVKDWIKNNMPASTTDNLSPKPTCCAFPFSRHISDYTLNVYHRTEQLKKLQEAYSLLRQKLQDRRRSSSLSCISRGEPELASPRVYPLNLTPEDKNKIAVELLAQNAEFLGLPVDDLKLLDEQPFNEALKKVIDCITNMVNSEFSTNLKNRCESARRKASIEYRDEMEKIQSELDMYKKRSEELEITIDTLNCNLEENKNNDKKIMELQASLKESNKQVKELKKSLKELEKTNEEMEKNEINLEETLLELEKYKLESEKLSSVIKDLEMLKQQKTDNEELIKILQQELDQYKSKSNNLNEKIKDLEKQTNEKSEPLLKELSEAYEKLSLLQESLERADHEKDETNKELESKLDEIESEKQKSQQLESSITELNNSINDMKKEHENEVNDLQTCLNDANSKVKSLENALEQLKQLNQELDQGENQIAELQSKLDESNVKVKSLEDALAQLEAKNEKYNDYDENMENLKNELKKYADRVNELESAYENYNESSDSELNAKLEALKGKLEAANQLELEKLKTDLEAEKEELKTKLEAANQLEIEKLKTDLEAEKEELKTKLEGEKEELKNELEAKIEKSKEYINTLKNDFNTKFDKAREYNENYRAQVESLQNKLKQAYEQINRLEANTLHTDDDQNTTATEGNEPEDEKSDVYSKKSSRKGRKKSHRDKDSDRSGHVSRSHSRKHSVHKSDKSSTDGDASDANIPLIAEHIDKIADQMKLVKQSTLQFTDQITDQLADLGYDKFSNVGTYLSGYIFGNKPE